MPQWSQQRETMRSGRRVSRRGSGVLVFSGSQVLERVDFVRCDKHVLLVSVKAEWNRLCLFGRAEDEGLA